MEKIELYADVREEAGTSHAKKLRAQGKIPGVVYKRGEETVNLALDRPELLKILQTSRGENVVVTLKVHRGKKVKKRTVIIKEVQHDPVRDDILHIDFFRIQKGVAVEVEIPISIDGVPEGVRQHGGILDQIIYEVRVKCIPSKIPETVPVEVSALEIGDAIRVADVDLGEDVEILLDPERTICHVVPPRVLEVEAVEVEEVEEVEGEEVAEPEEAEAAVEEEGASEESG